MHILSFRLSRVVFAVVRPGWWARREPVRFFRNWNNRSELLFGCFAEKENHEE
jgi:hypothetical protein